LYQYVKTTEITQGYFTNSPNHTIRVRMKQELAKFGDDWVSNGPGGQSSCITIKGPRVDITCDEFEYSVPNDEAKQLLKMCDQGIVKKIRHTFHDEHGQRWEIDEFIDHNKGMNHLAELELPTADTPVYAHDWLIRDVSNDPYFVNSHLATHVVRFQTEVRGIAFVSTPVDKN
jgi:adenylate cyclase